MTGFAECQTTSEEGSGSFRARRLAAVFAEAPGVPGLPSEHPADGAGECRRGRRAQPRRRSAPPSPRGRGRLWCAPTGVGRLGFMRVLVQRVSRASVTVDCERVAEVGRGLLVLVGVTHDDEDGAAHKLAAKTARLRVFADDDGLMNRSVVDVGGEVLAVSQFTLYGDARRGNRPSFTAAANPEQGEAVYAAYVEALRAEGVPVETGIFGAHMRVELVNDGPVTILLEA